jgi:hypothetical protein
VNWFGTEPQTLLIDPVHAKELLGASDRNYRRPGPPVAVFKRLFGRSIIGVDGEDWTRQHRLLYKACHLKFDSLL